MSQDGSAVYENVADIAPPPAPSPQQQQVSTPQSPQAQEPLPPPPPEAEPASATEDIYAVPFNDALPGSEPAQQQPEPVAQPEPALAIHEGGACMRVFYLFIYIKE